mmetsp:Transcript_67354/g.210681  ORF Transcript_67354/g.210681 Transcript_67354/m.210681 type:complete len:227 (-) Transcript_67354:234-914(-)
MVPRPGRRDMTKPPVRTCREPWPTFFERRPIAHSGTSWCLSLTCLRSCTIRPEVVPTTMHAGLLGSKASSLSHSPSTATDSTRSLVAFSQPPEISQVALGCTAAGCPAAAPGRTLPASARGHSARRRPRACSTSTRQRAPAEHTRPMSFSVWPSRTVQGSSREKRASTRRPGVLGASSEGLPGSVARNRRCPGLAFQEPRSSGPGSGALPGLLALVLAGSSSRRLA